MDEQNPRGYSGEEHYYMGREGKITPPPPAPGNRRLVKIMTLILAALLIIVAALTVTIIHLAQQPKAQQPASAPSRAAFANTSTPTPQPNVPVTETPGEQPAPSATEPVSTSTPVPYATEKISHPNIRLHCNCSDPIVVTITQIDIQPQQNRMLWSLTLSNTGQVDQNTGWSKFSLQEGDHIGDPTQGGQTFDAMSTGVYIKAGEVQHTIVTFSFVPYQGMSYTLVSELEASYPGAVTFDPIVIQF